LYLRWRGSPRRHYIVTNTEVRARSLLLSENKRELKLLRQCVENSQFAVKYIFCILPEVTKLQQYETTTLKEPPGK